MRQLFYLILLQSLFSIAFAQQNILIIQGSKPSYYLAHKVSLKENFYSIGRLYNISPKEIAPFNKIELLKGLSLGQTVLIPLTTNNFVQSPGSVPANEALVPVYHLVQENENTKKESIKYNVPVENLKKWNNLRSDAITKGSKIIVGYLKVSKELSAFANKSVKKAQPIESETKTTIVKKDETIAVSSANPIEKNIKPAVESSMDKLPGKESQPGPDTKLSTRSSINLQGGFFKDLYIGQENNKSPTISTGTAGVFKSTSGWKDGKYYCFNNEARQGTIIKVTNTQSGKIIYAKVLDLMPEVKQNTGLILQLSNAAADELGVSESKFECSISYYK